MRQWIKVLVFSSLLVPSAWLLVGCGFHLRQPLVLPEAMTRTQLRGVDQHGVLAADIRDMLAEAGAQVVEAGDKPGAVLVIGANRFDRRVSSVDSLGKVTQYELRYQLSGSLNDPGDQALVEEQRTVVMRYLNAGSGNVLGSANEEELLRREMQRDAVRQLVRQLRIALDRRTVTP